jgi:hypothetical protein
MAEASNRDIGCKARLARDFSRIMVRRARFGKASARHWQEG